MPHRPKWFTDDEVVCSNAPTCGINKDGNEQYAVDTVTGKRLSDIDDKLLDDARCARQGKLKSGYLSTVKLDDVRAARIAVPAYFDRQASRNLDRLLDTSKGFKSASLRELVDLGWIIVRGGHGSPSADQRVGDVPYIKVSDLRAGHVNINPTNMIPLPLARQFWGGSSSGLVAYDLVSPERASKNIGDFCVLMPGQEQVVMTREVIIVRANGAAPFDQFYLLWALTLAEVRAQWGRLVLMQTNREDVGDRTFELRIPVPESATLASKVSRAFRDYFLDLEAARTKFSAALKESGFKHSIIIK